MSVHRPLPSFYHLVFSQMHSGFGRPQTNTHKFNDLWIILILMKDIIKHHAFFWKSSQPIWGSPHNGFEAPVRPRNFRSKRYLFRKSTSTQNKTYLYIFITLFSCVAKLSQWSGALCILQRKLDQTIEAAKSTIVIVWLASSEDKVKEIECTAIQGPGGGGPQKLSKSTSVTCDRKHHSVFLRG